MTAYGQGSANRDDRATHDPFQFHFLHTSVSCRVDKRVIVPGKTSRGPVVFHQEKKKVKCPCESLELHVCCQLSVNLPLAWFVCGGNRTVRSIIARLQRSEYSNNNFLLACDVAKRASRQACYFVLVVEQDDVVQHCRGCVGCGVMRTAYPRRLASESGCKRLGPITVQYSTSTRGVGRL